MYMYMLPNMLAYVYMCDMSMRVRLSSAILLRFSHALINKSKQNYTSTGLPLPLAPD